MTERTYIMIKPDGVQRGLVGSIVARFEAKGFKLLALKQASPAREHLERHYADLSAKKFFPSLIEYMASAPVVAMVWEGEGVVAEGRKMLGATKPSDSLLGTIRGDFCIDIGRNVCHGSDCVEAAEAEIALWFPEGVNAYGDHSAPWVYEGPPALVAGGAAGGGEGGAGLSAADKKRLKKERQKAAKAAAVAAGGGGAAAAEGGDGEEEEAEAGGGDGEGEGGAKKKKKKKKPKKKKGAVDAEFAAWCAEVLARTPEPTGPEVLAVPASFAGFDFTGELRPAMVTPQVTVPEHIVETDYARDPQGRAHSEEVAKAARGKDIEVLEGEDLENMRECCRLGREVIDVGGKFLKKGVTGDQVDRIIHAAAVERNSYPSPLNYYLFPKSVCVSPNEVICHGIPDCRPIQEGDIINLDVTVYYKVRCLPAARPRARLPAPKCVSRDAVPASRSFPRFNIWDS